jgi:hypothetical protein
MDQFDKVREKLQAFKTDMPQIIQESFRAIAPLVEDLNIAQLNRGQRADGTTLPDYSPTSVLFFGKDPGPMNMHHTGAYWRGIKMTALANGIELEGTDMKSEMLELRYGGLIGLQDDSKDIVSQELLPVEIEQQLRKRL